MWRSTDFLGRGPSTGVKKEGSYRSATTFNYVPGKPVAYNSGLLSMDYGLLWGIVASYFGLLGLPGAYTSMQPLV